MEGIAIMEKLLRVILWPFKAFAGLIRFIIRLILKALAAAMFLLATLTAGGGVVSFFYGVTQAWENWDISFLAGAFLSLIISGIGLWVLEKMLGIQTD